VTSLVGGFATKIKDTWLGMLEYKVGWGVLVFGETGNSEILEKKIANS